MSVLENFTKKVTNTAKAAARKSSELVEVTKLNMNINAEEEKIKKVYTEIGKKVYGDFAKGEEIGEEYKNQCEQIEAYENNINEMKQKVLELKDLKRCPGCGAELESETVYCPKCGAKQ